MRILLLLIFCLQGCLLGAEEMKIALIQPRVAEGSDPCKTIEISMVRGELRKAFCRQSGYQVLTRTDVDAILAEHCFQQSGLVDDVQRQKVGNMTGAHYLCLSTITKEATQLYIEAYLINIETGQMTNSATQYANIKDGDYSTLPSPCNELAKEMLNEITACHKNSQSKSIKTLNAALTDVQDVYIDLGLPSGTRWMEKNIEGLFSYDEVISKYSENLPSKQQFDELKHFCKWIWTSVGYKVLGPNGKSIILPVNGWRTCSGCISDVGQHSYYWSSTPYNSAYIWTLHIATGGVFTCESRMCGGRSVRLVR
jgi:hypothetical protein